MKKLLILELADNTVTILGIIMIGYGLYHVYPPLCWIVIGAILSFPGLPRKGVD